MHIEIIAAVIGGLVSSLLALNAVFISRLVSRVEAVSKVSESVVTGQGILMEKQSQLAEKVKELSDLTHRINMIEKQQAVLEYVLRGRESEDTLA